MVATLNDKQDEIPDGAIFVKANVIEWVGKTRDLPAEYQQADQVISLRDRVVIPGMVGTPRAHAHDANRTRNSIWEVENLFPQTSSHTGHECAI